MSGSSRSGLWGLLCQKSCPLIAGVSLREQAAGKDGLGHWQAVSKLLGSGTPSSVPVVVGQLFPSDAS